MAICGKCHATIYDNSMTGTSCNCTPATMRQFDSNPAVFEKPRIPMETRMSLYQIVDCSFKSDGSGRAYGYKIPQSWEPKIGQKLKVPDSSGDDWKLVTIVKLDGKEIPNVPYKWGLELVDAEAPAESNAQKVQAATNPAPNETPNDPDFGGALIGKALAADLASPDPVALRQNEAKPFVPAPPHPGTRDEW